MIRSGAINWGSPINWGCGLNAGLVSWWLARQGIGGNTWYDLNGLNHGTLTSGPVWQASTRNSGSVALNLDATNDLVSVPTTSALDPVNITVSCWVYVRSYAGNSYQQLVGKANSSWTAGWAMVLHPESSGKVEFFINDYTLAANHNANAARTNVPLSTWTHLCGTYDAATVALYVNGISVATMAYATGLTPTSNNLVMGFVSGLAPFDGLLDDVRVYNRALSVGEAWKLYSDSLSGYPLMLNRIERRFGYVAAVGDELMAQICC